MVGFLARLLSRFAGELEQSDTHAHGTLDLTTARQQLTYEPCFLLEGYGL